MDAATQQPVYARPFSGIAAVLATAAVLTLISSGVARHPASLQTPGNGYFWTDVALLLTYGAAGIWVWAGHNARKDAAIRVGSVAGLLLATVLVANHVIELFVPARGFALVIGPVLLTLGLLAAAGSATWQRTASVAQTVLGGLWCAVVAVPTALTAILTLIFVFEGRAELPLKEPFAASGMSDPAAFLMRNSLEAASELLTRLPVFALFLSFLGGLTSALVTRLSPRVRVAWLWIVPLAFAMGTAALAHAESLERSARPPFVMLGVVLTALALSAAHPVWGAPRRAQD